MTRKKEKVLVALSGGVDSSVSAALLLRQGYDVTGAFMKQWTDTKDMNGVCQWKQDRRDALRVAAHLGIPLLTCDFEKEYEKWVLEYMFAEYEAGRTPNPDVLCNKYIKFGVWLEKARALGFNYIATGHYARIEAKSEKRKVAFQLFAAKDGNKDQTYFLHQLNQEQLAQILFPVGSYTKKEVRALAKKYDLPTADRKESMGICFVGNVPMKEFLQQKIAPKKGSMVMTNGTVIGEHDGLAFYTIGQRHIGKISNFKFQISKRGSNATDKKEGQSENRPVYVVGKNQKTNELIVGFEDDPALYAKEVSVNDMHWVAGRAPEFPLECEVRLRHRQPLQHAACSMEKDELSLRFREPQKAATPGQFAVLYRKGECLGGGVIADQYT